MANFLAIEWDGNEARVAIARRRGREMVIDDAFSIPLEPRDPGQTFVAPNVGARLAAELASRNIGKIDTLVAVGRKDIELRTLSVPPAPADELPDVVRLQALRQFSALGDDWPLDFIPLNIGDEAATSVLAATLSPDHVKQIRATCEAGGLVPRRMVLRPMAAASLLSRQLPDAGGRCRLMIDMLSDEADLTVLMGEKVVFLRTARLSSSHGEEASNTVLLGEIRRTIVAAQNQLGGQRVEYIVVCGNPQEHATLVERLARDLSMPVECFDPFAALPISDELRHHLPEHHGRFAPLLGMLVDEAAGTPHAIDFLNPRKRPAPKDNRKQLALYGSIAAALVLLLGGFVYYKFYSVSSQLRQAQNELNVLEQQVKPSEQKSKEAAEVDKFAHGDIVWLNELHRLSQEKYFPSGEDAMVTQIIMGARARELPPGGGMTLDAVVKDIDVVDRMTASLSDDRHIAGNNGPKPDPSVAKYPYKVAEKVIIYHPDADLRATAGPARGRGRGAVANAPTAAMPGSK